MNVNRRQRSTRGKSPEPQQRRSNDYGRHDYHRQYPSNNAMTHQHMNVQNSSMNYADRGLRNRRHSDLSGRYSNYDDRRSSSLQDESEHEYYYNSPDRSRMPQFSAANTRWVRQRDQKTATDIRYRIARAASLAITTIIFLGICFWSIEIGMGFFNSTTSWYFNNELKDAVKPPSSMNGITHEKVKRKGQILDAQVSSLEGDRGLRGVSDGVGTVIHPEHDMKQITDAADKTMDQKSVKDVMNTKISQLEQNLGNDATMDFFYAGKSKHDEGDGPFNAFSYASLPFSDCNQFALSVWVYLSPKSESEETSVNNNEDKPPRVILTTKTDRGGEGCISSLFASASAYPATGMILYALPHHGDRDENGETYRVMLEYAVANESRCRTLAGFKPVLIQEGEWHHVVLFATLTDPTSESSSKKDIERISLYVDGVLDATDERVTNRLCDNGDKATTIVGRYLIVTRNNEISYDKSSFDLNGRIGMLAFWETGGSQVRTDLTQRMQVQSTRDEEHVVRSMNRARFDVGAIRSLSQQGLTVKEPNLLYTFDEKGDENIRTKLMLPSDVKEVITGLDGETAILSPYMKTIDRSPDDKPFVPQGGSRFIEYKNGTFVPLKRSRIELRQLDELARVRSLKIKEAMAHLWRGYQQYAWGRDELLPISNGGQDNWGAMGTTLVDSLSTLWLLGMKNEFWEARDWVQQSLNFNNVRKAVSVFETTIRVLASMLSAFDLSGDIMFLEKADDLGTRLLKAFSSPSGVPYGEVELFDGGRSFNTDWHPTSAALAEIGTLQIEFRYLAQVTGKTEYATTSMRALDELLKLETETGLYPTLIHNLKNTLSFANNDVSIGAMGDSFYEYLLKIWLQGGKSEPYYRTMYDKAVKGIMDKLICRRNGLTYVAELKNGKLDHKMDHLSCFLGGNMALGAYTHPDGLESEQAQKQLITGKQLAYTCYQMYARGQYGLPSEYVKFLGAKDDFTVAPDAPYYILRPETAETFFILYHLTKDNVYREWGWEIFRAIETSCRTESGYAALKNVNTGQKNNRMESFFPAETLKYLYLLQDSNHKIDLLDQHVFNTEAHPLRLLHKIKPVT